MPNQVQQESRCLSSTKDCHTSVKCFRFSNPNSVNQTETCAKDVPCVQPLSIVECPIAESLLATNKGLFSTGKTRMSTAAGQVFISGSSADGATTTAVTCRFGDVARAGKDKPVFYTCSESGVLGRSVQEYTCPAGAKYSTAYLKCVLGGK